MNDAPALPLKRSLTGLIVFVVLLVIGITALIVYAVVAEVNRSVVAESEVYALAAARLASSDEVERAAGSPVSLGPPERITVFTNLAESGQADFAIPVSGPLRSGRAQVTAEKQAGAWVLHRLVLRLDGLSEPIDLLRGGS